MEPTPDKSTKTLFTIFIVLVFLSIGATYYRYMVKKDFTVTTAQEG